MRRVWKAENVLWSLTLAILAIVPLLEGAGLFGKYEGLASTLLATIKRERAAKLVLVRISAEDIQTHWSDGRLTGAHLASVVQAVAAASPASIMVDFSTASPGFGGVPLPENVRVIWAQRAQGSKVTGLLYAEPCLSGNTVAIPENCGLATVVEEPDGVVRTYRRAYRVQMPNGRTQIVRTLVTRALDPEDERPSENELMIDFRPRKRGADMEFSLSQLLARSAHSSWRRSLTGQHVLIMGAYDATDEHKTPVDWKKGGDVLAAIVETELDGGGSWSPSKPSLLVVAATAIVILWLWFHYLPWKAAVIGAVPLMVLLAVVAAGVTYGSTGEAVFFAPVLLAFYLGRIKHHVTEEAKG